MDAVIRLKDVRYRYSEGDWILRGVDLTVQKGAYVIIFGANGSGKSTLAYLFNGLIPSFFGGTLTGTIRVDGVNPVEKTCAELFARVGLVLQNTDAQIFNSNVENEIAFGLESLGLPANQIEARIHRTVDMLNVGHLLERSPFDLSGGEKRLVAIASVLCLTPHVIVVDEPYANLDRQGCRRVRQALQAIHRRGTTIVVIEHRLGPHLKDATQCCILQDGRVVFEGTPRQTCDQLTVYNLKPSYCRHSRASQPHGSPVLRIRDLDCRIDERLILQNISFDIREGEAVALIGPNGAGKTSLIKHLNGLIRPTRGDISLQGVDVTASSPSQTAADVGLTFQNANDQFFKTCVAEELLAGCQAIGKAAPAEFEEICTAFGLADLLERSPFKLSEGEKKRVAIASILMMAPKLLVLDEPTAGQDAAFRELLARLLRDLSDKGVTIVIVTHDLNFARATTDRWLLLGNGRLVADGPPAELLRDAARLTQGAWSDRRETTRPGPSSAAPGKAGCSRLDPRTRLLMSTAAVGAVLVARHPQTMIAQSLLILICLPMLLRGRQWGQLGRLVLPMTALVFAASLLFFNPWSATWMALRLFNLFSVTFILFRRLSPDDMAQALLSMQIPYEFTFILTTAMRYVPLIGRKIGHIIDAQQSRGIDLRLKLSNAKNFMALLLPLLVQSFVLSDELALAMESRGFGCKRRTVRHQQHLRWRDYALITASLALTAGLAWWEFT